jgi:hypothetical protein
MAAAAPSVVMLRFPHRGHALVTRAEYLLDLRRLVVGQVELLLDLIHLRTVLVAVREGGRSREQGDGKKGIPHGLKLLQLQ